MFFVQLILINGKFGGLIDGVEVEIDLSGDVNILKISNYAFFNFLMSHVEQGTLPDFLFPDNVKAINLRKSDIAALPEQIGELHNLEELDVSLTGISKLPDSIGNLSCLKKLNLGGTRLAHLPEGVGELHNLEELDVSRTLIRELPSWIKNLRSLNKLHFERTSHGGLFERACNSGRINFDFSFL